MPKMKQTTYKNPWASYQKPSFAYLLTHLLSPSSPTTIALSELPVVHTPNFEAQVTEPRMMWLGHASCYLELPIQGGSYGILFDPIFSNRYALS